MKTKQTIICLMILSLLAMAGCNQGANKDKEIELKEKELALKERELELRKKGSDDDDSDESEDSAPTRESSSSEPARKGVYTPSVNSPERKAIMNSLRGPVERDLKQEIIFKVTGGLKVSGDWAFLQGEPLAKSTRQRPDPTGTKYADPNWKDYDNNVVALLRKKGGQWTIVEYEMMCGDVCWSGWAQKHGAPKEIFKVG